MRLWSLHPSFLDQKGLVACWRESLLAQAVFQGRTKGYKNHPQLRRFRECGFPLTALRQYLWELWKEATFRGYSFNHDKINKPLGPKEEVGKQLPFVIEVTSGQMDYERGHLLEKLFERDLTKFELVTQIPTLEAHPLFKVVDGEISPWEKVK